MVGNERGLIFFMKLVFSDFVYGAFSAMSEDKRI